MALSVKIKHIKKQATPIIFSLIAGAPLLIKPSEPLKKKKEVTFIVQKESKKIDVTKIIKEFINNNDFESIIYTAKKHNFKPDTLFKSHNAPQRFYSTILHVAATLRTSIQLERVLKEKGKANINVYDSYHKTPLHTAIEHQNEAAVKLLLDHGADIIALDGNAKTALKLAEESGNQTIISTLRNHRDKLVKTLLNSIEKDDSKKSLYKQCKKAIEIWRTKETLQKTIAPIISS